MRSPHFLSLITLFLLAVASAHAQVPLPCLAFSSEVVTCDPDARPGEVEYSFKVRNISGRPLRAIQLSPTSGANHMTPSLIEFPALAPDDTIVLGPVHVFGTKKDEPVLFCVLAVGVDPAFCCVQGHRFEVGDCGPAIAPLLAANGFNTRPCDEPVIPGACMQICDDYISCDDRACYYYSFTVTNRTNSIMDHIFMPDANISPNALRFPDPLAPGEAARVWVEICNASPGPYTVPIVLASCRDWSCCSLEHIIELPECPCISVRNETRTWSTNPDGSIHIDYSATIVNQAPWDAGKIILAPLSPTGTTVETMNFPLVDPPTRHRPISTGIDVPAGSTGPIKILIVMHATDFSECCLRERTIGLTETIDDLAPIRIDRRAGGISLNFTAPEGELCCVQHSADLTEEDWETIQAIDGIGQDVQMEVGTNTSRPQRFFRLMIGDHEAP
jgi:hypothetical protein